MTKRKPMTVASIIEAPAPAIPPVDEEAGGEGKRPNVKQLTLYLPLTVHRQLRELAFHEEKRLHGLVMEGLDRVFADRGLPPIQQLTRKS